MGGPSPGIIISTYWWVRSFLTDLPGLSVLPDREHRPMILPIYRSPARMKICDRSIRAILNTGFYLISGGEIMIIKIGRASCRERVKYYEGAIEQKRV